MGIDKKTLAVSKTYANKVALGFQSVTQTTTGFKITFKDGSTATYTVQNMHEHANKNVLDLLTKDANGNLLFDGKEITPDFLDTTGDGTKFLADDGTYKTVTSGTSYDDTEVRQLIADNTKNINTNKTNIVTNNINIATNKADIKSVNDKIGNTTLPTTATTLTGAIKEVDGNQLGNVSFSADYKNIVLNRKNGTNPYIIPISAIINHANFTELYDVDNTDIGNGKTIVYDATTGKHKYVDSTGTDEFVKMEADGNSRYLADLIDKQTIVNDNGILKVKKLDGQEVTIAEINQLKGLTMNVMELVGTFANGGVKVINTPLNTASELSTMDRSTFIDGISYIVYVLADENHAGVKTTYLVDKTNTTFFGNADSQRDFTTNPLDLASEVTGKLGVSNIDTDNLWKLLTVDNTYKTLTATNNAFGTHGAKALYDELVAGIGAKANKNSVDTHIGDTTIHITQDEKDSYALKTDIIDNLTSTDTDKPLSANQGKVLEDNKLDKTDIVTTIDSSSTDDTVPSAKAINTELDKINDNLDKKADTDKVVKKIYIRDTSSSDAKTLIQNHWSEFDGFEFYNLRIDTAKWAWDAEIYAHTQEYGTVLLMSYGTDVPSVFYGKLYNGVWTWKELATVDNIRDGYAKIIKNNDTDTEDAMFISYKNKELFGIRIYKNDGSEHELKISASGISYTKNGATIWTK